MITKDTRSLEEKILDIWAEHVNGYWNPVISLTKGWATVELHDPEETWEYKTIKEAADACLYTIDQWLKED